MRPLPTGSFKMAPLSDFKVTVREHWREKLPRVYFMTWIISHGDRGSYELDYSSKIVIVAVARPMDVEPVLHNVDVESGWTIKWP